MARRSTANGRMAASRSIIVLEAPWGLHEQDQLRVSVLPFIQGMAQACGDMDVLHSRFFDQSSFDQALEHLTAGSKYENSVVYIAGHGAGKEIQGVEISHMMFKVGLLSRSKNISGILLGSCLVGDNTMMMEVFLKETALRWMAGYRSSVGWMKGTLIDISILQWVLKKQFDIHSKEIEHYKATFASATHLFDKEARVGEYDWLGMEMGEALVFAVQPAGRGRKPVSFRCTELRWVTTWSSV